MLSHYLWKQLFPGEDSGRKPSPALAMYPGDHLHSLELLTCVLISKIVAVTSYIDVIYAVLPTGRFVAVYKRQASLSPRLWFKRVKCTADILVFSGSAGLLFGIVLSLRNNSLQHLQFLLQCNLRGSVSAICITDIWKMLYGILHHFGSQGFDSSEWGGGTAPAQCIHSQAQYHSG